MLMSEVDVAAAAAAGLPIGLERLRRELDEAVWTGAADDGPAGPALRLRGVALRRGDDWDLRDVDLVIAAGERVAIVGLDAPASGRLLRVLAGRELPDGGSVRREIVDTGAPRHSRPDAAAGPVVRSLSSRPRLLPWKSVVDNVAIGLEGGPARTRSLEALARVGLRALAARWPDDLRHDEPLRVAIARVLAHQPGLLLLDDPLSATPLVARQHLRGTLEALWPPSPARTLVLATQDLDDALVLADRLVLVDRGRIVADEPCDLPLPRGAHRARVAAAHARWLARCEALSPRTARPLAATTAAGEAGHAAEILPFPGAVAADARGLRSERTGPGRPC